jgi:hypothetical protein
VGVYVNSHDREIVPGQSGIYLFFFRKPTPLPRINFTAFLQF